MIYEILNAGRENAIETEQLVRKFNFTDKRELQRQISKERKAGLVILSTCENNGGYYKPANDYEVKCFIKTLSCRASNTFGALKSAKKMLEEMENANT